VKRVLGCDLLAPQSMEAHDCVKGSDTDMPAWYLSWAGRAGAGLHCSEWRRVH
jgi:hypothetical protein